MKKVHGFTLVELLIVISIIAMLAALLFPVFTRALESARRSHCISNMRQLGVVFRLYAEDWDDRYPWAYNGEIIRVEGASPSPRAVLDSYVRSLDLWRCPSDIGETFWNGPIGFQRRTPPFYEPPMRVGDSSYLYPGVGFSRYSVGEIAGLPTSAVRRPSLAWLLWEGRPWHGSYRPDESAYDSLALYNVLYCDGHVAKKTLGQRDADEVAAWSRKS